MGSFSPALALLTVIAFSIVAAMPAVAQHTEETVLAWDGIPVVCLSGSPEVRGAAYGSSVGPLIKDNLRMFWEAAEGKGISSSNLVDRALAFEQSMPEHMLIELRATADAAGIPYGELLAMNRYGPSVSGHDGCTIFAAVGSGSETGNTIASKNRDANKPNILLVVEPYEDMHGFVAVTGAGEWGVSFGLNDAGLCDGNNWMPVPEYYEPGLGELPLNRLVLEMCSSVDDAIEYVVDVPKYGGTTVMVADSTKAAFIEAVSTCYVTDTVCDTAWQVIEDGVGVHTNHYTLEPFISWVKEDEFGYFWVPSVARYDRGLALLEENDCTVDSKAVISFTRDLENFANSQPMEIIDAHPEFPWGTWGFGWPGFSICNSRTVSAGVFEIDSKHPSMLSTMWTSINNPCYSAYFPVHNGLIADSAQVLEGLSDYVSGDVWKLADRLRESSADSWGELVPLLEEWEDAARERNDEAESTCAYLLDSGDPEDAVQVLVESDVSLGLEAYALLKELSAS